MARRELTSGSTPASQNAYVTTVSPGIRRLVLAFVANRVSVGETPVQPTVQTLDNSNLVWALVGTTTIAAAPNRRLSCFRGMRLSGYPVSSPILFNFGAQVQGACAWSVFEYDVDDFGAVVQSASITSTQVTSLSVSLPGSLSGNNALAAAIMLDAPGKAVTPGPGMAEIHDLVLADATFSLQTQDRVGGGQIADWSWTGAQNAAAIAVEIKAAPEGNSRWTTPYYQREIYRLEVQQVRNLGITGQPNAAVFEFETTFETVPVIEIFRQLRDQSGRLVFSNDLLVKATLGPLAAAFGAKPLRDHNVRIDGLEQDAAFSYRITAVGGPTAPAVVTGVFRTGRRIADVFVHELRVYTDGDSGLGASGEFSFSFGFYDETDALPGLRFYPAAGEAQISAGDVRENPFGEGPAFRFDHATDRVAFLVFGVEKDSDVLGGKLLDLVPPNALPESEEHGEDDHHTWAQALQKFELPSTSGPFSQPFSLKSGPWGIFYEFKGIIEGRVWTWIDLGKALRELWKQPFKWSTTAVVRTPGQKAKLGRDGGKRLLVAHGPNGVLAYRPYPGRKQPWKAIESRQATSFTVVSRKDGDVDVFAVTDKAVLHFRLDPAAQREVWRPESDVSWCRIGAGIQSPVEAVSRDDDRIALLALDRSGAVRGLLYNEQSGPLNEQSGPRDWQALGGAFAGRVSAVSRCGKVEVVATSPEGVVSALRWSVDSDSRPSWTSIDGPRVALATIVADDSAPSVIVGITAERDVLHAIHGQGAESLSWVNVGNLDALMWGQNAEPSREQASEDDRATTMQAAS